MMIRTIKIMALCIISLSAARPGFSCATSDNHKDGPHSAELDWEAFKKQYSARVAPQGNPQLGLNDATADRSEVADLFDKHGELFED